MKDITFNPMTQGEYNEYIEFSFAIYIEQQIIAGLSKEEAEVQAKRAETDLIPNGFKTEHNYFYNIKQKEETVGYLWMWHNVKNECLFLPEIYIKEAFRGKGIGEKSMEFYEEKVLEKNLWNSMRKELLNLKPKN